MRTTNPASTWRHFGKTVEGSVSTYEVSLLAYCGIMLSHCRIGSGIMHLVDGQSRGINDAQILSRRQPLEIDQTRWSCSDEGRIET